MKHHKALVVTELPITLHSRVFAVGSTIIEYCYDLHDDPVEWTEMVVQITVNEEDGYVYIKTDEPTESRQYIRQIPLQAVEILYDARIS